MELHEADKIVYVDRLDKAISLTYGVIKSMFDTPIEMTKSDIFVVWHCKTLQNWKAILSAGFPGAPLVEVTYNGDKKETYVDIYRKLENIAVPD